MPTSPAATAVLLQSGGGVAIPSFGDGDDRRRVTTGGLRAYRKGCMQNIESGGNWADCTLALLVLSPAALRKNEKSR